MKEGFLASAALEVLHRLDQPKLYPRTDGGQVPHAEGTAGDADTPLGLSVWHYAFILATLSGLSMPIGAILGIRLRPDESTVAKWIALGAGALLFAVAVELYGHAIHSYHSGRTHRYAMVVLMATSIFGSFFFTWVSGLIEGEEEHEEEEAHSAVFAKTPQTPLPAADENSMDHVAAIGEKQSRSVGNALRQLKAQNQAKAKARWKHIREAIKKYHIIKHWNEQAGKTRKASMTQLDGADMDAAPPWIHGDKNKQVWANLTKAFKETVDAGPSEEQLSQFQKQNRAAALTMLTMLIVDGVPEGILMGFMAASGNLGLTFIVSLSIANFPEAFAGGVMMEMGGFPRSLIIGAWASLMLLVGSLAGFSCYLLLWMNPTYHGGHDVPFTIQILVATMEGMAGGAMISGISACMLPEAFERRDKKAGIVFSNGFLTTFGFLLSVCIKISLDGGPEKHAHSH